jgi:hypothetical protein
VLFWEQWKKGNNKEKEDNKAGHNRDLRMARNNKKGDNSKPIRGELKHQMISLKITT